MIYILASIKNCQFNHFNSFFFRQQVLWIENLLTMNNIDIRKFLLLIHNFLDTKDLCISKQAKKERELKEAISDCPRKKYCLWIEGPR